MIKTGNNKINKIFFNGKNISKAFLNNKLIYHAKQKPIQALYSLTIPKNSLGWKLLDRDEWVKYRPYNTNYIMFFTFSSAVATGNEFFGLLDKSDDSNDFRIFANGSYMYVDPGSKKYLFTPKYPTQLITIKFNGKTNNIQAAQLQDSGPLQYTYFNNSNAGGGGMGKNTSTLYLNAFGKESDFTTESFTFYELLIKDQNYNTIKRIVPSDDPQKLYECVSNTYIEPCRTLPKNSSRNPTLNNLLSTTLKSGFNEIMLPYYIIPE